eukprot:8921102-Pyramimonas_sp.AAC.1
MVIFHTTITAMTALQRVRSAFARAQGYSQSLRGHWPLLERTCDGRDACPAPLMSGAYSDASMSVDENRCSNAATSLTPVPHVGSSRKL